MIAALLYLQFHSVKNRLRVRVQRLKKPKYLIGGIVGGLYFYFYFFRFFFAARHGNPTASLLSSNEHLAFFELLGAFILFSLVFMAWVFPHQRAALSFTEAEVAFLFPAPVSRRGLIHFKLLKSQFAIFVTTIFLTLLTRRFGPAGNAWRHAIGWWMILSMLNLHFLGSSFARMLLLERGISNWLRRLAVFLIVAVGGGAIILWSRQTMVPPTMNDLASFSAAEDYAQQLLSSGPALYLLYPFQLVVRPFLALDVARFLSALWPALLLLGLHYFWVIRSNVAFEEASVELSRRTAERVAAARSGQLRLKIKKRKRPLFELHPTGFPATAIFWKNLISAGNAFSLRLWILLALICLPTLIILGTSGPRADMMSLLGMASGMLTIWSLFLGPQILRQDLRQDLPVADILKLYPIRGWQLVLGEVLAPAAILTVVQCLLLLLTIALLRRIPGGEAISLLTRLSFGLSAAIVLPAFNLISLLIPNAAVLLFPSWFQTGKESPQGIEATGQRLIFMLGQILVFLVSLIPAALAFTVAFLPLSYLAGPLVATPVASIAATLVLSVEAALAFLWLGRLFERFDLSAESTA